MNFDWNSLPPEAQELIRQATEKLETPFVQNAIPEPEREEVTTLQTEQQTLDEITSTDELITGDNFPVRDVTPAEVSQETNDRQHEHHAPRLLDEAMQLQSEEKATAETPAYEPYEPTEQDLAELGQIIAEREAERTPEDIQKEYDDMEKYYEEDIRRAEKDHEIGDDD